MTKNGNDLLPEMERSVARFELSVKRNGAICSEEWNDLNERNEAIECNKPCRGVGVRVHTDRA